jgi:hypothetical protein
MLEYTFSYLKNILANFNLFWEFFLFENFEFKINISQ